MYVNCSIGDALTEAEIAAEAKAAEQQPAAATPAAEDGLAMAGRQLGRGSPGLQLDTGAGGAAVGAGSAVGVPGAADTLRARTPRGFDRLLSAGFTPAEVNQLRLQFRSIQASRHTPDTMPSPDTLRNMEDMWIDNNDSGAGLGGEAAAWDCGGWRWGRRRVRHQRHPRCLGQGHVRRLHVPLGTVGWLIREEDLWSRRWQVFATFGFVVSLTIGMIKALSGDK